MDLLELHRSKTRGSTKASAAPKKKAAPKKAAPAAPNKAAKGKGKKDQKKRGAAEVDTTGAAEMETTEEEDQAYYRIPPSTAAVEAEEDANDDGVRGRAAREGMEPDEYYRHHSHLHPPESVLDKFDQHPLALQVRQFQSVSFLKKAIINHLHPHNASSSSSSSCHRHHVVVIIIDRSDTVSSFSCGGPRRACFTNRPATTSETAEKVKKMRDRPTPLCVCRL